MPGGYDHRRRWTPRFSYANRQRGGCSPNLNEGEETPLRSKNRILALNRTEDLVLGYDLTLKELTVDPETFALMDGGTLVWDEDETHFTHSTADRTVVTRAKFTCDVWTEEKDGDGETLCYQRFRFPNCKGSPVSFTHTDGSFCAGAHQRKPSKK